MKQIFAVAFMAAMLTTCFFLADGDAETKSIVTAPVLVTEQEMDVMFERFSEVDALLRFIGGKTGNAVETSMSSIEGTVDCLDAQIREMLENIPDIQMKINDMSGYTAVLSSDLSLIEPVAEALEKESQHVLETVSGLEAAMANFQTEIADFNTLNARYQEFFDYVAVEPDNIHGINGPHVLFTGTNVHIRTHRGYTEDFGSGSGNLIIGYNEDLTGNPRTGENNLIVGPAHSYSSWGGFIAGFGNFAEGASASVSGGTANKAGGDVSSVSGGTGNAARGRASSIRGGLELDLRDDYGHIPDRQQEIAENRFGM